MKNQKYVLSMIIFFCTVNHVFSQTWQWSKNAGGNSSDFSHRIAIDNIGNSYIIGVYTSDSCYFYTDTLIRLNQTSFGSGNYFLAKYNSTGNEIWVKGANGTTMNNLNIVNAQMDYDSINNYIYITGGFKYSGNIGGVSISTSSSEFNMFLAKLDTSGNCLWATKAEAFDGMWSNAIAVDRDGNITITGQSYSSPIFDTISIPSGDFLARYDSSGNCIWAKSKFNTNGNSYGFDAIISKLKIMGNDIYALGNTTVASFTVDAITVDPNFQDQYFIARFDSVGVAKWVKPCAGSAIQFGVGDIIVDEFENSYITGLFDGIGIFQNDTITDGIHEDMFLAKYNSIGNLGWVKQASSSNSAAGKSLSFCNNGFYATGFFIGNANFGNNTLSSGSQNGDIFIAKYDTAGNCIGVIQVENGIGSSICIDTSESFYITGGFDNSISFGLNTITSNGSSDYFVSKSTGITAIEEEERRSNELIIYANPTQGTCNVTIPDELQHEKNLTLSVYDNTGKLIQKGTVQMNEEKVRVNLEAEAKGIYNVTLGNGKKNYSGKIIFE